MTGVTLNLKIDEYGNRVLGVIKAKYGLNDKSQALNKFLDLYGEEFVDKQVKQEIVDSMNKSYDEHIKKHGFKSTKMIDLRKQLESSD
jgi:recombinational DNA repair protein (RecF pathway)